MLAAADYCSMLSLRLPVAPRRRIPMRRVMISAAALAAPACASDAASSSASRTEAGRDTIVVYLAASLTRPFKTALDSFAARQSAVIQQESGASLEHARKITELHRVPDLIALADREVFPQLLVPAHASWYADFARNRMVVAYTSRSRHATDVDSVSWTRILAGRDVQVGRPDPDVAPAGYRTILTMKLAERYYRAPGLAERLLQNAPRRNMRSNAAELAALLRLGDLDFIYDYESVAIANGFRYVRLPPAIDLGEPSLASVYAQVAVRVRSVSTANSTTRTARIDSVTINGEPIVFALGVPRGAPHRPAGERLAAFLLSPEGRQMLRAEHLDALEPPRLIGDSVPAFIRAAIGR